MTIEKDGKGGFHSKCSCPTLASFRYDCQHIAAVLLSIYEQQRQHTIPSESIQAISKNQALTDGLLSLFNDRPVQSSGHQLHFEKRKVLDLVFTCKLVSIGKGRNMFGIKINIDSIDVQNIRDFLEHVKDRSSNLLSISFTYDPSLHCFQKESDAVIQQLIQVINDEKVYMETLPEESDSASNNHILLIPPSSWDRLLPVLEKAPMVKLEYDGKMFDGLHVSDEPLPLQFNFAKRDGEGLQLKIKGLNGMAVINAYQTVLFDGKLVRLKEEESERLSEMKQMLNAVGTNKLPIPQEKINYFIEKVVPGLRKLGDVQLSGMEKTPLNAMLYLDRVKGRLLAGLEFHYENIVINPLETREPQAGSYIMRDVDKEDKILQLMDDSMFTKTEGGYFFHNEDLEYE